MVNMRPALILGDSLLVITIIVMNYTNGGVDKNPLFLNFLVLIAFSTCVIRHFNYYKLTKKIY